MKTDVDGAAQPTSGDGRITDEVVLSVENVSLAFGGVKAIQDVSFDIRRGEVRAGRVYPAGTVVP